MEIVNAANIARPFRDEVTRTIQLYKGMNEDENGPRLVGLLGNDDDGARKYAEWTQKACREDGIIFDIVQVQRHELEQKLEELNRDSSTHGIIIYYPIFGNLPSFYGSTMDDFLRDQVNPSKDVEGLSHYYRNKLNHNERFVDDLGNGKQKKCVLPCTALAVVKCLEHLKVYDETKPFGDRLRGRTVTVINRSEVVGRPLAAMLANDGATVYSVDIDSIYLFQRGKLCLSDATTEKACLGSDAIILGVPSPEYKLPLSYISDNTILINVSSHKNVSKEELQKSGKRVTFVPSVGKVTVAMLERNTLRLFLNFHSRDSFKKTPMATTLKTEVSALDSPQFSIVETEHHSAQDNRTQEHTISFTFSVAAAAAAVGILLGFLGAKRL
eukprot:gene3855-6352_t